MTVNLRDDIYWSDGEQFTADDVVFTVETQMDTPGMNWSGAFSTQVETVEAVDDQTVHFTLQAPNSRFHSIFSVRWNGAWIMPEHIFSGVENVLEYDFADPVGLGPYVLHSYDPNGNWYIWEKREDWDRTSVADFGEPTPQYVIYRNNMPIDNRLIEMRQRRSGHDPRPLAGGHVLDRRGGGQRQGLVPRASRTPIPIPRCRCSSSTTRTRSSRIPACAGRSR